jgi:hypothetical protein
MRSDLDDMGKALIRLERGRPDPRAVPRRRSSRHFLEAGVFLGSRHTDRREFSSRPFVPGPLGLFALPPRSVFVNLLN